MPNTPTSSIAKSNFIECPRLLQRLQLGIAIPRLRVRRRCCALGLDHSRIDRTGRVTEAAAYVAHHCGHLRLVQLVLEGGHMSVVMRAVNRKIAGDRKSTRLNSSH